MPDPRRGVLRVLRTLVVAVVCAGISVSGHVAGGGSAPGAERLGLLLAACLSGSAWASGRRWTFGRLLLALAVAQVGTHLALAGPQDVSGTSDGALLMLAGHLVAALVLAALLARAEELLWHVLDLLAAGMAVVMPGFALGVGVRSHRAGTVCPVSATLPRLRSVLLVLDAPRRGPPVDAFPLLPIR